LQARKQQLVRDAIWDAAIDLFAEKGFNETTVDDIAEAAGTSRRSFFRYFESKSDLMTHGMVSYGASLTDAILSCPPNYSLSEVLRHTVLQVAQYSAAQPRTPKIMEIAAKYPAAREAQIARVAEVQDQIAAVFARRCKKDSRDDLTPHVLAGLTLSLLGVTFRSWFDHSQQDISVTVEQVFATLDCLVCDGQAHENQSGMKQSASKRKQRRDKTESARSESKSGEARA
jgi:AcrR family transcriptional regulator